MLARPHSPDRSAAGDGPVPSLAWRLIGRNHRDLGRAARSSPDVEAVAQAVEALRADLAVLTPRLVCAPEGRLWHWRLLAGSAPLAQSARGYQRQQEARYSLQQFLAAVPTAEVRLEAAPGRARPVRCHPAPSTLARGEVVPQH